MKLGKQNLIPLLTVLGLSMSNVSQATLINRGGGLIYDDVLDITWLQDANYAKTSGYHSTGMMTWDEANEWAGQLNYGGYDDWRLTFVLDHEDGCEDSRICGYNVNTRDVETGVVFSEMAYMFHDNLGNLSRYDINETENADYGLRNKGLFTNIESDYYWSGNDYASYSAVAWIFNTTEGGQTNFAKDAQGYAWAVRNGDASTTVSSVPVPTAVWLFGSGLMGLIGLRKIK